MQRSASLLLLAIALTAAHPTHGAGGPPRRPERCPFHYAGACDPDTPCYRKDLKNWRFGGARDFECFIIDHD